MLDRLIVIRVGLIDSTRCIMVAAVVAEVAVAVAEVVVEERGCSSGGSGDSLRRVAQNTPRGQLMSL